ncbi:MAG: hypothetical protein ACI857_001345 [Arenicella sp.]|jgi:hypothetical protein
MTLTTNKLLGILFIVLLNTSCSGEKNIKEETKYFTFERSESSSIDTIIYKEEYTNRALAEIAIGNESYVDTYKKGTLIIDGISIYFVIKYNTVNDPVPCICSDYSGDYLNENGAIETINGREYRMVEGQASLSQKHWIELCIDMKHQIYVTDVSEDKADMIKEVLVSIKMKV